MEHPITLKFKIPRQDLLALSLFEPNTEAASSWAQSLPLANGTAPARLLVQALNDLNRTPLSPQLRYNMSSICSRRDGTPRSMMPRPIYPSDFLINH